MVVIIFIVIIAVRHGQLWAPLCCQREYVGALLNVRTHVLLCIYDNPIMKLHQRCKNTLSHNPFIVCTDLKTSTHTHTHTEGRMRLLQGGHAPGASRMIKHKGSEMDSGCYCCNQ